MPYALDVALWVLAAASLWTVGQRLAEARRSARDLPPEPAAPSTREPRLTDLQYAAGWRLVRLLPERVAHAVFRLGADLAVRRNGPGRAAAAGQPGPASVPRESHAGRHAQLRPLLVRDVPAQPRRTGRAWSAAHRPSPTRRRSTRPSTPAAASIIALSHSGNWDAAGVWLIETLRRRGLDPVFTTVGQRLRPESVYRRFVAHRVALGFDMVEEGAYRALLRRLRGGGVVCVLADRDVLGASLDVTLLGEPARLPSGPGPAGRADRRHAAADPAGVLARGLDDRVRRARPAVPDVEKATQALGDALMELVADDPTGWHVLQPLWTADRR